MRVKMYSKEGVQGAGRFTHNELQGQHMFYKTVRTSPVIYVVLVCC